MIFVITDSHIGSIDRYETGGTKIRRTHGAIKYRPVTWTKGVVESFRLWPDPAFAVEPPPRPTNSPAGAGTVQIAMAA